MAMAMSCLSMSIMAQAVGLLLPSVNCHHVNMSTAIILLPFVDTAIMSTTTTLSAGHQESGICIALICSNVTYRKDHSPALQSMAVNVNGGEISAAILSRFGCHNGWRQ